MILDLYKPVYESKAIYSKLFTRNKVREVELKLKGRLTLRYY
jgi:hypothetical protein